MKKILFIGTVATTLIPISVAVSCSPDNKQSAKEKAVLDEPEIKKIKHKKSLIHKYPKKEVISDRQQKINRLKEKYEDDPKLLKRIDKGYQKEEYTLDDISNYNSFFGGYEKLSDTKREAIKKEIPEGDIALVVIAEDKDKMSTHQDLYTEYLKIPEGDSEKSLKEKVSAWELIKKGQIKFNYYDHPTMGAFINSFFVDNHYLHGTITDKNYYDFYPMFFVNGVFSNYGVSSTKDLKSKDVLTLTYNKKIKDLDKIKGENNE